MRGLVLLFVLALVIAACADSSDGGRSGSSGGGGGNSPATSTSTSTGAPMTYLGFTDATEQCTSCLATAAEGDGACTSARIACEVDEDCVAAAGCYATCADAVDITMCMCACQDQHPSYTALAEYVSCACCVTCGYLADQQEQPCDSDCVKYMNPFCGLLPSDCIPM
jgi:hypothetical protein